MIVHELNAGTLNPPGAATTWGAPFYVCRCLLIETATGLVAVDAGIGLRDIAEPDARLGTEWLAMARPSLDPDEALVRQVQALGYHPGDLSDILLTHHHRDHVGGLGDLPHARVHALDEVRQGVAALRLQDRSRLAQWDHNPVWAPPPEPAPPWQGLDAYQPDGIGDSIRFVALPGHAPGHAGVLVEQGQGWLLHVGDAAFHPAQHSRGTIPPGVLQFVLATQVDPEARRRTEAKLTELNDLPDVQIVTAHGPLPSPKPG